MMVVLGIITVLSGIAVINLRKFDQSSTNAANQIASLIKSSRAYGMTSTVTVQIKPVNTTRIQVTAAASCSTTTRTNIPELALTLPDGATLNDTTWSLCYTSRGISRDSLDVLVRDYTRTRTVQIVLGGGVRVI